MFETLKKALVPAPHVLGTSQTANGEVGEWAAARDIRFATLEGGNAFGLVGATGGKPWKLECGPTTRDYIFGEEVRARAEVGVGTQPAVIVMNRALKEVLEERAYGLYTDSVQTDVQPGLIEEMRWLASYIEVGWEPLSSEFVDRYVVLADRRSHAMTWLVDDLAEMLLQWPEPGPDAQVPFIVMLMRGRVHLRMERRPADLLTLAHAVQIMLASAQSASAGFGMDIPI
jgi:hypothetical protein